MPLPVSAVVSMRARRVKAVQVVPQLSPKDYEAEHAEEGATEDRPNELCGKVGREGAQAHIT